MGLIQKFYLRKTEQDPIKDVIRNLKYVLNTKKNFGSILRTMGVGDYNAHRSRRDIVATIVAEIKENIQLHEPRVNLIDLHEVQSDSAFRIRFELKCVIVDHAEPIFIIFDSVQECVNIEG